MPKTIHRTDYRPFLELVKKHRLRAGLTQAQCSEKLGRSQSFMSDVESGSRRLDIMQLRDLCHAFNMTLPAFIVELERDLKPSTSRAKAR